MVRNWFQYPNCRLMWEIVADDDAWEAADKTACQSESQSSKRKTLSVHSEEGRKKRAQLMSLSITELRRRLASLGDEFESTCREHLVTRLLESHLEAVSGRLQPPGIGSSASACVQRDPRGGEENGPFGRGVDYSKFDKIDFSEYGVEEEKRPDFTGTLEGFDTLLRNMGDDEKSRVIQNAMRELEKRGVQLPVPPAPECNPMADFLAPLCEPDAAALWPEADTSLQPCAPEDNMPESSESEDEVMSFDESSVRTAGNDVCLKESESTRADESCSVDTLSPREHEAEPEVMEMLGDDWPDSVNCDIIHGDSTVGAHASDEEWEVLDDEYEAMDVDAETDAQPVRADADAAAPCHIMDCEEVCERSPRSVEDVVSESPRQRVHDRYFEERRKLGAEARVLEAVDVDGWSLDRPQFDLVEEADDDLNELRILLRCCGREENRKRIQRAIREFEVRLRVKRTWAWFPVTRWRWSGQEYEKPMITLDFKVPGSGHLPPDDIHCDFGIDWFDLKIWNVEYPEDPGVKYHHRVKKTRLMRDIVPSQSFVKARGDHVYVYLQKVFEVRHGYCAWPDLSAGKGRKPFKYNEDAPDGGLMEFFEGEYEKHEGYDGFRRDIGKAMEKIHRCEPIRGVPDGPMEEG